MKKINLIKRLWKTDSHEKQKPQRFGRYAAMLIMLLTLGVGQMWAAKVTVKFKVTGWSKVYAYTWDGDSNGSWPGGEITSSLSNGWYSYNLTSGAKIIFNNNSGKQTNNIENVTEDVCYIWVDDTKKEKKDVNCDGTIDGSDVEYFYRGTSNSWGATKMTQHALGLYSYIGPYSQNDKFKIALSSGGWDYGWDSNVHDLTFNGGVASGLVRDEGNYKISPSGSYYIMVYHPNTSLNNTSSVKINIRSSLYNPSYTITYKDEGDVTYTGDNGGSLPSSYTYGTGIATLTAGEKAGYDFGGWYTNSTCTEGPVTSISSSATGAKTFYAKWTASSTRTLTYHANWYTTGTSGDVPAAQVVAKDRTAIVAGRNTLAMTNYTFSGWNTEEYITGTHYDAGDDITMSDNINLYAEWTRPIPMDDQGATTGVSTTVYGTYNCTTLTEHTNPAKTGYTFGGWYSQVAGAGSYVISPEHVLQANMNHWTDAGGRFTRYPSSITSLYAKWTQSVILNANTENHGSGTDKTATATWNKTSITIPTHCSAATGYSLDGYYTAATGGTKILNADGSFAGNDITVSKEVYISDGKWMHPGATTLYAQYTAKQYTITFDRQSGSSGTGNATVHFNNNDFSVSPVVAPTRTGYTFGGYYTGTSGSGEQIVNASGVWQNSKTNYLDGSGNWIYAGNKTLYAKWTENMTTVTLAASPTDKGTFTSGGGAVTSVSAGATTKPSVTAVPATGYRVNTSATVWTKSNSNITLSSTTTNPVTVTGCGTSGTSSTLTATFTPKTYTITLHEQGATTHGSPSDDGTISVTYDATTNINTGLSPAITAPLKTGYNFGGYWNSSACTDKQLIKVDGWFNYDVSGYTDDGAWVHDGNVDLYAKWVANKYTITFDKQTSAEGYYSGGTWDASKSVYYDGDVPSISGTIPTAANGYKFVGFYTEEDGGGEKVVNADKSWVASVTGYTDADRKWIRDGGATLYAYYKKAEITELTVTPAVVATEGTVAATPTIDPMPEGTTEICWELQYSNGTPLPSQPTFSQGPDNSVIFTAPSASATYRIQATLRKGSTCDAGDVLSTEAQTFQVAGEHTVTVQYQDGDGRTLKDTIHIVGRPLEWSDEITAPEIFGYTFTSWTAGDGVTLTDDGGASTETESDQNTIQIKAVYDGTLTANYTQKQFIYFKNTLEWSDVYVNFYTDSYWNNPNGSGNNGVTNRNKHMTRIDDTDIWYYDYGAASISPSLYVSFTSASQDGYENFWLSGGVNVVYPANYQDDIHTNKSSETGFKAATPMFIPLASQDKVTLNSSGGGKADYYNAGYWTKYTPGTGYTLEIYNEAGNVMLKSVEFTSEDELMPMKAVVDLEAGHTYKYQLRRGGESSAGIYYGNSGTMTYNDHGQGTPWAMTNSSFSQCGITTNAAGDYTFHLSYSGNSSTPPQYRLRMAVDYPIASGDYCVIYKDNVDTRGKASAIVTKVNNGKDTVSFFIRPGSSPVMKIMQASVNASTGAITWTSYYVVPSDMLTSLSGNQVYNVCIAMNGTGGISSVEKIEPYTGNYYIRTDCAGTTKWDNYKALDHQMTYSDYAKDNSGFTHYFVHWVTSGSNVKFCIANDYSPCISDTLCEDIGTVIADITEEGEDYAGKLNSANANIRFMWDQRTNTISRAYIGGSGIITDRFLVLEGDAKMYDEYGHALTGDYQDHDQYNTYLGTDDQVIMHDDQNFLYERIIKVNTSARAKLTAKYNSKVQYFKGSEGDFAEGTTIELLGGDAGGKHKMRIVYDFKTNRLVTAYLPEGEIDTDLAINADLMLVREHQEEGQQITFNGGSLTDVHTVYGVMRFNRWTLNNKEKTGAHGPVGDPKSVYERSLYWISFPFDVNLSDVFGFGTYGEDWIIEYYDGESRAANGYWIDSPSFWRFVMPAQRPSFTLEAGKGYVLALEIANMKYDNTDFWTNNIEQVELFFPSAENVGGIEATDVTTSVHEHACTIDRTGNDGPDINKNRTRADSHWNMIGVPSYANYGESLTSDGETVITWNSAPYTNDLPFLYEWNMVDDSYTVQSGTTYPFKSMHSYMVQYHGNLCWHLASATPASAPRLNPDAPSDVEFRLELQQNDISADQTFVKLSNNENVSADFVFDEDLSKEFNKKKANIYTLIDYIPAAGNVLPLSTSQKTIVPVGVQIQSDGEYTFSMPDGTEGIGITLIDNETGEHTNLGLTDYTVNLNAGSINDRFVLEISPVSQTTTDIETVTEDGLQITGARKVMIDGILYIVRDGQVFDARGARVQ